MTASTDRARPISGQSFDAILFDLDGTLIDSTGPTERAWLRWAQEEGLGESYNHTEHGKPALSIVRDHVPAERIEAALARAAAIEIGETDGIVIKAGARDFLSRLSAGSWAIVTSCTRELAAVRMAAAGLNAPEVLVTVDDISAGKPDPEGYRQAAARLGVDPIRCLVVEDAPAGLEAAHRAGCTTLAVAGTFPASQLAADTVVESLTQVGITITKAGITVSIG
ncbi:HAD-IA family hydrolase [Arthrobacter sp. UYEF36]|uniref:HAD-IA family hydrolase n=1 Tax=Arthrobacter sp. UYEF36 TaxID=1756366 RepID=UPI003390D064